VAVGLWVIEVDGVRRVARGEVAVGPQELLPAEVTLERMLASKAAFDGHWSGPSAGPAPAGARLLAPVPAHEVVWASGVTYERSRSARIEESNGLDFYDRVYDAPRPELFAKSLGSRVRAHGEPVGIRADASWSVPEPELALVVSARGELVGCSIGNDMSSRDIEGENPLYLPQAKTYRGSCAVGPCIVPIDLLDDVRALDISISIERSGAVVFEGTVPTSTMRRSFEELVEWLFLAQDFPDGVVVLTGTGIVPDSDFTLRAGDTVAITVSGLGFLRNPVEVVGSPAPSSRAVSGSTAA
jgi:2-dehydro-3-deoxy-D-arabinonate dehydratase